MSQNSNYQDLTTAPLSRAHDDEAAGQDDGDQLGDINLTPDTSSKILPAVDQVSFICTSLRSCQNHVVPATQDYPRH
jgi:hypothetical protein